MIIREACESDLDAICIIEQKCFSSNWSKQQYDYELKENDFATLLVMEDNNQIIGYIDYYITFEMGQLSKIAVDPQYQGKHLAYQLMEDMEKRCKNQGVETISLEVRVSNIKAQKLYEHFGYIQVNVRKRYYDDGEDALLLVKPL